jgi:hypothetical protein
LYNKAAFVAQLGWTYATAAGVQTLALADPTMSRYAHSWVHDKHWANTGVLKTTLSRRIPLSSPVPTTRSRPRSSWKSTHAYWWDDHFSTIARGEPASKVICTAHQQVLSTDMASPCRSSVTEAVSFVHMHLLRMAQADLCLFQFLLYVTDANDLSNAYGRILGTFVRYHVFYSCPMNLRSTARNCDY